MVNRDSNSLDLQVPCDGEASQEFESVAREVLHRLEATLSNGVAIVVTQDRRDIAVHQLADRLFREETIVDDVTGADNSIATEPLDLGESVTQGVNVCVDVGNDPQTSHPVIGLAAVRLPGAHRHWRAHS
jgi:hypothetical protein